ncbi:MAG: valine--tRNA ligase [Candidatus Thermoplasmatota archaeon]|nr:valine--tRNA ligase [Candidatus Thermoplasmatota archaeon]
MPYDFKESERKWSSFWNEERVFQYDFNSSKPTYSIDTPPRYASGKMHIGHAFHYSHIDMVAKYHKIKGEEVFFPLCFDVNGMPIEVNVEKKYGIKMREYDRQKFVKLCEEFAEGNISAMIGQFSSLGITADPSLYFKTNSEMYRKYTQISFIRLYDRGLAYKGKHPVNWCPRCETAIAESEIVYEERDVFLNDIRFRGDGEELVISTTRPELIPACVAVAVNPKDDRYAHLVGTEIKLPIFGKSVSVIADEDVLMDFGTGAEMICSVGDKSDLKMIYKHSLPFLKSIDEQGRLTEIAGRYAGLQVKEAKKNIVEDLKATGDFVSDKKIKQNVGTCWRCGTPLEFLQKEQWFIKSIDFKEDLKKWAKKLEWHPQFMKKRLDDWIDSLSWDWVVSRQRYFATPIPVWECKNGHQVLAREDQCYVDPLIDPPPVKDCPTCHQPLKGSEEVFDTWMDSSISPLFNSFYVRDEKLFSNLYPMSLRPQGQDIIRTWAYYSLLRGNLLTGENPWKNIMVDGNIMAPDGRPMHASWGNVVDPNVLLEKYGADAFRYFTASCSLGEDTAFRERDLVRGQRLMNKIFNLVSFLEFYKGKQSENGELRPVDHWILRQMNGAVEQVRGAMDNFEFDRAIRVAESFIWHDLADNYVEIIKHRISGFKTYDTAHRVLLSAITMIAPMFPFIAEDSYQRMFRSSEGKRSVFELQFPTKVVYSEEEAKIGETTVEAVSMMRDLKVKEKVSLSDEIREASVLASSEVRIDEDDVRGTIRAENISYESGQIEEKVISIKLTPDTYAVLREKAEVFLKNLKENPGLLNGDAVEFEGKQIRTTEVIATKSYSIRGRNVNCGNGFCVAITK